MIPSALDDRNRTPPEASPTSATDRSRKRPASLQAPHQVAQKSTSSFLLYWLASATACAWSWTQAMAGPEPGKRLTPPPGPVEVRLLAR